VLEIDLKWTIKLFQGGQYVGKRCASTKICGVSILRAGETMEQAVCDVCKDIRIGKILIQTNKETDEPELYYLRLPKDIKVRCQHNIFHHDE